MLEFVIIIEINKQIQIDYHVDLITIIFIYFSSKNHMMTQEYVREW